MQVSTLFFWNSIAFISLVNQPFKDEQSYSPVVAAFERHQCAEGTIDEHGSSLRSLFASADADKLYQGCGLSNSVNLDHHTVLQKEVFSEDADIYWLENFKQG